MLVRSCSSSGFLGTTVWATNKDSGLTSFTTGRTFVHTILRQNNGPSRTTFGLIAKRRYFVTLSADW